MHWRLAGQTECLDIPVRRDRLWVGVGESGWSISTEQSNDLCSCRRHAKHAQNQNFGVSVVLGPR